MDGENVTPNQTTIPETTPAPAPVVSAPPVNYEDLIAKAREQEKGKLYPEIEKLKGENVKLIEKNNSLLLTVGEKEQIQRELEKAISQLETKVKQYEEEGKMSMEKDKTVEALQKEIEALKAENAKKDEEFKAFINKAEVASHMSAKIKEAQLDEDLIELVQGNTKEEVDASIAKAVALQEKIKAKYVAPKAPTPDNVPLPKPNTAVLGIEQLKTVKPSDIMTMDRDAWKKMRKDLGLTD